MGGMPPLSFFDTPSFSVDFDFETLTETDLRAGPAPGVSGGWLEPSPGPSVSANKRSAELTINGAHY